jgi:hypothetical protein
VDSTADLLEFLTDWGANLEHLRKTSTREATLPFHLRFGLELFLGEPRSFTLRLREFGFLGVETFDQAPPPLTGV